MQTTAPTILRRLRTEIDTLPQQMQAAAKYIIDHPADFGLDPIRLTADKIGVSSNVLVRLAHHCGFQGFEAFRKPFRQTLVTDREDNLGQSWLERMQKADSFSASQAGFAQNELNVVSRSLRLTDPATLGKAVEIITTSTRCFVTASRSSYALAHYFSYTGRMAYPGIEMAPLPSVTAIDTLLDATSSDCLFAITVQPYSAETIQAMRFATQNGIALILLSDSDVIAPGVRPDVTLPVSTRALHPLASFTGAMAVLECLLGHLFEVGGEEASHRVDKYQKARENSGAYWQPAKLPRVRKDEKPR